MSELKTELRLKSGQVLQVRQGDLTQEKVDAIVNAANEYLQHGGGVAGAIVRQGGDVIQEESDRWVREHGRVPTGEVAVTGAGDLPCRYVIHAVGPVWYGGERNEDKHLRYAAWNSLLKADALKLRSIALPAISSGIFGFPKRRGAQIMIQAALDFCAQYPDSPLVEIRFTNIDAETVDIWMAELKNVVVD
jgi:putative ATPase